MTKIEPDLKHWNNHQNSTNINDSMYINRWMAFSNERIGVA